VVEAPPWTLAQGKEDRWHKGHIVLFRSLVAEKYDGPLSRPSKVFFPGLFTGIEDWDQFVTFGIKCRGVRALTAVAQSAGEAKIGKLRCTPMLARADVINLMRKVRTTLRQPAVFAAPLWPLPNLSAEQSGPGLCNFADTFK
jgi:hypothetical protein